MINFEVTKNGVVNYKIYRGGKEKHRDVYNTGFIKQQSRELSVTD